MKHALTSFFMVAIWLGLGCSSGTNRSAVFYRPVDIVATTTDIGFEGTNKRFLYVANQDSGTIAVIDQIDERLIDTDRGDDFDDSPIPVGGEPIAIEIDERSGTPRVFVADRKNNQLTAFDMVIPTDINSNELVHTPVDLGGTLVARATTPGLVDRGRRSSPVLPEVTVDAATAQLEQWEVRYIDTGVGYEVIGSKSGRQSTFAQEGQSYSSDNGEITFTVQPGASVTSSDDLFRFGTVLLQPAALGAEPVDMLVQNSNLYIITNNPASLIVYNLDTLTIQSNTAIADGGPNAAQLGRAALGANTLFIPNRANTNAFSVDLTTLAVTVLNTGIASKAVGVDATNQILYVVAVDSRSIVPWDIQNTTALASIRISDFGLNFVPFTLSGSDFGLVSTIAGTVDIIELSQRVRLDTRDNSDDKESYSTDPEFFDMGARSTPNLVSVSTNDTLTQTERWELVFEGVVPGTQEMNSVITGTQLTVAGGQFVTLGIVAGDKLIVDPHSTKEEVTVASVVNETTITLDQAPQLQGAQTTELRPSKSYIAFGSVAGVQMGRVTEGTPYTTDNGEISLTIRPSIADPTTRGDLFSFLVVDGVDPILTSSGRMARNLTVVTRPNDTVPTAYVVQQGDNSVTVINLQNLQERKVIR